MKNIPELRFKGFNDGWNEKLLNEYLIVTTEKNSENKFDKENVLSVSGEHGVVNQIEFQGRSFAGESLFNYKVSDIDSVIYTKSPLNANPYGIIKSNQFEKGIVSVLYAVYKTKEADSKFIQDYFDLDYRLNNYLRPLISKGAKNTINVSDNDVLLGNVIFPKRAEQQKIGTMLSKVDSLIDLKTKKLESLKSVKKSLLQKCFPKAGAKVPEMRFAGFSGEWEEKKLGEIADISSGTTPSRMDSKNFEGNVCWLTSGELKSHYVFDTLEKISTTVAKTMRWYKKGTVVIAIYGLEAAGIRGTCSILAKDCTISQACMAFTNLKSVSNEYLYCWYLANGNEIGTKYAQGTKQQNLSSDIINDIPIQYPSITEQQKIGEFFSKYDSLIALQQKKIDKLKTIKKSLLQKMFV